MSGVIRGTDSIFIDGSCWFLTCLETGPHGHDMCPDCGAVRFGNLFCRTCLTHAAISEEVRAVLLAHLSPEDDHGKG